MEKNINDLMEQEMTDNNFDEISDVRKEMFAYLNIEFQQAKKNFETAKIQLEAAKIQCERLRMAINDIEKALPGHTPNPEYESYERMSVVDATYKLLSIKGELTTQQIYNLLKERGKRWEAKSPLNSLNATLHNAAKINRKGICHVGYTTWGLRANKEILEEGGGKNDR